MNLLIDKWIPIQQSGLQEKISLGQLLCGEKEGELCLPRDDMELACLQLIIAITQVLFTPNDKKALAQRINNPLCDADYIDGCKGKKDWFDLNHSETPFMQFRGVKAKEPTGMEKLMAGVADGTNKAFVNPQGLVVGLCSGCAAIALYNMAYNVPSMGGGFKSGMRGSTPITVMIKGESLRKTIGLNLLTRESLETELPWYQGTLAQKPNYVDPISANAKITASQIGLVRGLLWQPAHFELCPANSSGKCSCCGEETALHSGFNKEKFNYTVEGVWPHPLSARMFVTKKGLKEEKFPSFTTTQPTWVHLAKLVAEADKGKEGYSAVPVIRQLKRFGSKRLDFVVGGYRNNQATVLERRHELFSLANGWQTHSNLVDEVVALGQFYKQALRKALFFFDKGIKDKFAGSGVDLTDKYDAIYYQSTEAPLHELLATLKFSEPSEQMEAFRNVLKICVIDLFNQATAPYRQEPKMLKALAASRRLLHNKYLKELEIQQGGTNE